MELNKSYQDVYKHCKKDDNDCKYKQFKELQNSWLKYCLCEWNKDHYECKMNTNQCHNEMEKLVKLRLSYSKQFFNQVDEGHLKEVLGIMRAFDHHQVPPPQPKK